MDYKKMYEELQQEFEQYKKESIKWSVEDFLDYNHPTHTVTREQAQEALECMIRKSDYELGTTWYDVEYFIERFGHIKKEKAL